MSLVNSTNSQFNQTSVNSKQGVVCAGQTGGGFGSTNNSLTHSANNNLGKGYPAPIKYTSCDKQSGGAHNYDSDFPGQSYGFTKVGAGIAQQFKGSYAPITVTPKTNMCGGKKRRRKTKKRKRRRKNKSRKSRRKRRRKRRRTKRRKRAGTYSKLATNVLSRGRKGEKKIIPRDNQGRGAVAPRSGLVGTSKRTFKHKPPSTLSQSVSVNPDHDWEILGGGRRRRTRRKRDSGAPPVPPRPGMGRKNRRTQRRKRKQGGGSYSQYGSNIPITPSYSSPNPSSMPWATGPGSISRQMNCRDNYNHYKN